MEKNINETRRSFLKKAAYAAPAIVVLGALSAPSKAHASNSVIMTNVDITVDGSDTVVTVPKGSVVDTW